MVESFDGDLSMFREAPKPVDLDRLRFLRWLVEHGKLEHIPSGPPSGELAIGSLDNRPFVAKLDSDR